MLYSLGTDLKIFNDDSNYQYVMVNEPAYLFLAPIRLVITVALVRLFLSLFILLQTQTMSPTMHVPFFGPIFFLSLEPSKTLDNDNDPALVRTILNALKSSISENSHKISNLYIFTDIVPSWV